MNRVKKIERRLRANRPGMDALRESNRQVRKARKATKRGDR